MRPAARPRTALRRASRSQAARLRVPPRIVVRRPANRRRAAARPRLSRRAAALRPVVRLPVRRRRLRRSPLRSRNRSQNPNPHLQRRPHRRHPVTSARRHPHWRLHLVRPALRAIHPAVWARVRTVSGRTAVLPCTPIVKMVSRPWKRLRKMNKTTLRYGGWFVVCGLLQNDTARFFCDFAYRAAGYAHS